MNYKGAHTGYSVLVPTAIMLLWALLEHSNVSISSSSIQLDRSVECEPTYAMYQD